jgi:hypothetical protein
MHPNSPAKPIRLDKTRVVEKTVTVSEAGVAEMAVVPGVAAVAVVEAAGHEVHQEEPVPARQDKPKKRFDAYLQRKGCNGYIYDCL